MVNVMQLTSTLNIKTALLLKGRVLPNRGQLKEKPSKELRKNSICESLLLPGETKFSRRQLCSGISLFAAVLTFNLSIVSEPVKAEDKEDGVIATIKSLFDPDDKTKSGKVLPKAYLKSAREVIKTLRKSLREDPKDMAKFRRTADAAKESIRDYLNNWKGQQIVSKEESYFELEKAFRSLANFYAKAGPSAALTDVAKSEILHYLDTAEDFL